MKTRVASRALMGTMMGLLAVGPTKAEQFTTDSDFHFRLKVLDACFGTKLFAATQVKGMPGFQDEAGVFMTKLFKSGDMMNRIMCIEGREQDGWFDAMAGEIKDPQPYDIVDENATTQTFKDDWDRVRALDACLSTGMKDAKAREDKDAVNREYKKIKDYFLFESGFDLSECLSMDDIEEWHNKKGKKTDEPAGKDDDGDMDF